MAVSYDLYIGLRKKEHYYARESHGFLPVVGPECSGVVQSLLHWLTDSPVSLHYHFM